KRRAGCSVPEFGLTGGATSHHKTLLRWPWYSTARVRAPRPSRSPRPSSSTSSATATEPSALARDQPGGDGPFDSRQWLATRTHGLQFSRAKGEKSAHLFFDDSDSMTDRYLRAHDRGCQCWGCPHQMRVRAPRRAHDPVE